MNPTKGSALVEVVMAAAVLAAISLAFLGAFSVLTRFHQRNMYSIKGGLLAEEGLEAVRLIKSNGWATVSALADGANHYLELDPSGWSVTSTPEIVDGLFYRTIRVSAVSRDSNDDIALSGGTVDPNTLLVESDVAWSWRDATTTDVFKAYITNI